MKQLHLIANAHLDPYWLWEWEEGSAAAISTFRSAADMCEEFDGFVFNHNEMILYKWVEEYEPELFERIQRLVREGRWHIMGGWYLQPDCNMPSGESLVRQILLGRHYFMEKFGVRPTTAINFDPFGHTRGLVQILAKSGYDSYLHCRPKPHELELEDDLYTWVGYDGSSVTACRPGHYNSHLGKAREKVERVLADQENREVWSVLWGVGNHGGGPSRQDLRKLADLMRERPDIDIRHSTPEAFFAAVRENGNRPPERHAHINPWAQGCYTSQIRIKQKHRELENSIFLVEKMSVAACLHGLLPYPAEEIHAALCDLMVAEFHDNLPGSSIQPVENAVLRLCDHGLEILSRVRARAFYALASGQPASDEDTYPILVYNPHPFPIELIMDCEMQPADQNWQDGWRQPVAYHDGRRLPSQREKEASSLNLDWRKRAVFLGKLEPSSMNRFDIRLEPEPPRGVTTLQREQGKLTFRNDRMEAVINSETGLLERYAMDGRDYLLPGAAQPLVIEDSDDPWGMRQLSFREVVGRFRLMEAERATRFSGIKEGSVIPAVRVIEEGEVRVVIESLLEWGDSMVVLTYRLPRAGTEIELEVRVFWNEKSRMLKLAFPTPFSGGQYWGQVAYGTDRLFEDGTECVSQQWVAAASADDGYALTCINDGIYGSDFADGEIRLSLLRSPAYSGHPILDRPIIPADRFLPRIDQGERLYHFWINGGPSRERLERIDREALIRNQPPFAVAFSPSGHGRPLTPLITLSDEVVQLTALKRAEAGDDVIIRLFEPTGRSRASTIRIPPLNVEYEARLEAFEIKTLRLDTLTGRVTETNLVEDQVSHGAD